MYFGKNNDSSYEYKIDKNNFEGKDFVDYFDETDLNKKPILLRLER